METCSWDNSRERKSRISLNKRTSALYGIHSQEALKEIHDKAYVLNTLYYDNDFKMLSILRHEALYAAFILSESINYDDRLVGRPCLINSLNELPEEYNLYNSIKTIFILNNEFVPYGICLLNKWCGFNTIKINEIITKKNVEKISRLISEDSKTNEEYHKRLSDLNKKLMFFISMIEQSPTININEMNQLLDPSISKLFKKLPKENIYLGFILNEALIDRSLKNLGSDSELFKLYRSGSRSI
jgi:hypothetical protein